MLFGRILYRKALPEARQARVYDEIANGNVNLPGDEKKSNQDGVRYC